MQEQSRTLQRVWPLGHHLHKSCFSFNEDSSAFKDCSTTYSFDHTRILGSSAASSSEINNGGDIDGCNIERMIKCGKNEWLLVQGMDNNLKRCKWITKSSDEVYVSFHDEGWGVPVFNDRLLFEMLTLSGLLIDLNWTQILKRRQHYRDLFAKFDHNAVAKMDEKDILEISSRKTLNLSDNRVRCIIENGGCIRKVAEEFGSFSGYIWSHVNHRPIINKHKINWRSIPLKTLKSEAISKDLVSRGFRLVSPVTVCSFMQATGMAIDHDIHCFRYNECVKIAERSWGLTNMGV